MKRRQEKGKGGKKPIVIYNHYRHHGFVSPVSILSPVNPLSALGYLSKAISMAINTIIQDAFLRTVLDSSTETRQQCIALADISESSLHSASEPPTTSQQVEFSKQQKLLYARLAQLRGLNRNAILQVRSTKQLTAEARQEVDRLHLQLQNLYYEERHLRGEIAACESYEYVGVLFKCHLCANRMPLPSTATNSSNSL